MKRNFVIILLCAVGFVTSPLMIHAQEVNISTADTTNQDKINREIFQRVYDKLIPYNSLPTSELVVKVALEFVGTKYLWASLESVPEQLHVFLDKTDCILFVEMCTCFALTLQGKVLGKDIDDSLKANFIYSTSDEVKPNYELLCHNIQQMRYRNGVVDGYSSRIHYTSEWLLQNAANGVLREFTKDLGEEMTQEFYYMSMHPNTYYQLSLDPCELGRIRLMEDRLNDQKPYYRLTQAMLRKQEVMNEIHSGDIIAFISPRAGLDLAHVAIAYEVNGEMHFIHASYGKKRVVIEEKTLADYATNGIRVARLF